jgi:predicted peroxiredoxin
MLIAGFLRIFFIPGVSCIPADLPNPVIFFGVHTMQLNRQRISAMVLAIAALSACALALQQSSPASGAAPESRGTVIVSITSGQDDLFKIMSAFHLAQDALEDGRRVILYFNGRGVTVPVRRLENDLRLGRDRPVWLTLQDLMRQGAEVVVAGEAARVLGMVVEDFIPGAAIRPWSGKVFSTVDSNTLVFTY